MLTERGDSQFIVVTGELNHQRMCGFTAKPSYLVLVLWPEQPLIFSFFPLSLPSFPDRSESDVYKLCVWLCLWHVDTDACCCVRTTVHEVFFSAVTLIFPSLYPLFILNDIFGNLSLFVYLHAGGFS